MIEKVQEYWNNRPCNIKHSTKEIGTLEYFEEVRARKYFVEPHIPSFAQHGQWENKKVLEIGCGIGTDTIEFARAGATVTAVDLSEKSLEIARKRAEVYGLSNKITFYQANAEELDKTVPVEPYDLIYSFGVLHHTPNTLKALQCLNKYTHKDTIIKLMLYYRYSWKVLWIVMKYGRFNFKKTDQLVARYSEAQEGCPVTYIYSKRGIKNLFSNVLSVTVDHIFPYSIPEYKNYQYKKVWYFRWLPENVFRWLEKKIGWHLLITLRAPLFS